MTTTTQTATETHTDLCAQAQAFVDAGSDVPESLRMEIEHADREACKAIRASLDGFARFAALAALPRAPLDPPPSQHELDRGADIG